MKNLIFLLIFCASFVLLSCGKKIDEAKQAMDLMKNMPEKVDNMQKNMNTAEARQAERRKKGDTLALPFKKLQEFLPKSLDGYGDGELSGQSFNMTGMSYSEAVGKYNKQSGDQSEVKITLFDYNQYAGFYMGLAWLSGYSMEDNEKFEKTFDTGIQDVVALEKYNKSSKHAEVTYALGWRFFLTLEGDDQSGTDFLKSVANKIDLKSLAKM